MPSKALNTLELERVLIEAHELHTTRQFLNDAWSRESACQTVESNQKMFCRHFRYQFLGNRHIPVAAIDHNKDHGRYQHWKLKVKEPPQHIKANWTGRAWIVEIIITSIRRAKCSETRNRSCSTKATLRCYTSIRNTPDALRSHHCHNAEAVQDLLCTAA